MNPRLALRGIDLTLGSFRLALDLELEVGCLGVFGPSGSGKTTLLELIAGPRRPAAGTIAFDGKTVADPGAGTWVPAHRRRIGYVPQDLALFPHLNVRDNIAYGVPRTDATRTESTLASLYEVLELGPFLDRRTETLSGGEKQRVALARALAAAPQLLLLDEPLTGLDQDRKESVLGYLQALRRRWAIPLIYVSHQADEIVALCDEVLVLREGALHYRGRPAEIFEAAARPAYRLREGLGTSFQPGHGEGR